MKKQSPKKPKPKPRKPMSAHRAASISRAEVLAKIERMMGCKKNGRGPLCRLIWGDDLAAWIKKMPARYSAKKGGL